MALSSRLASVVSSGDGRRNGQVLPPPLSRREWQVLDELSRGATNGEIAASLGVSANTVKAYVKMILLKLDTRNRTAAAAWLERFRNHTKSPPADGVMPLGEPAHRLPTALS